MWANWDGSWHNCKCPIRNEHQKLDWRRLSLEEWRELIFWIHNSMRHVMDLETKIYLNATMGKAASRTRPFPIPRTWGHSVRRQPCRRRRSVFICGRQTMLPIFARRPSRGLSWSPRGLRKCWPAEAKFGLLRWWRFGNAWLRRPRTIYSNRRRSTLRRCPDWIGQWHKIRVWEARAAAFETITALSA